MPLDSLATLVGKVQQRVGPSPDYFLVVDALVTAAREIFRDRAWTFRRREAQFVFNAEYATGTVAVTRGNGYADFTGATLTSAMVGRQLRVTAPGNQIVTISRVSGDRAYFSAGETWGGATISGAGFTIYNAFQTVPADFDSFISIIDGQRQFQLNWWSLNRDQLDAIDPARSQGGGDLAYAVVLRDYTADSVGTVGTLLQVKGSGSVPTAAGTYAGLENAVYSVEMTSATQFKFRKNGGSWTTGQTIDPDGEPQELAEGVSVVFPTTGTYVNADVFVIPVTAGHAAGSPRYECWPHIKADEARPYLYLARMPDLTDAGAVLPRAIPGDLVLDKAMATMYRVMAGQDPKPAGPYLRLAESAEDRAAIKLVDVIREDEARENNMVSYDWTNWPVYDSEYLASHDMGYELNTLY